MYRSRLRERPLEIRSTMTRLVRIVTSVALGALLLGCASPRPKPEWVAAPDADIAGQTTFGWEGGVGEQGRSILDSRIRDALRSELLAMGYVETPTAPDLVIDWDVVAHEQPPGSSPVSIGIGIGSWGSHVGGSVGASVPVGKPEAARVTNRITIRAVDSKDNREVWMGTTSTLGEAPDAARISTAIGELMQGFPPRRR